MRAGRLITALRTGLGLRCPRCKQGALFSGLVQMVPACPVCRLRLEREPGYFVGAIYINYAVTVFVALTGSFVLESWFGVSVTMQLAVWLPFVVIFPIVFSRYSKSLWLSFEYFVNPDAPPPLRRVR